MNSYVGSYPVSGKRMLWIPLWVSVQSQAVLDGSLLFLWRTFDFGIEKWNGTVSQFTFRFLNLNLKSPVPILLLFSLYGSSSSFSVEN
jgi:hypothetical protein